jgi:geranylgeranyl pyrophosphate synthase
MSERIATPAASCPIQAGLSDVRRRVAGLIADSPLKTLPFDFEAFVAGGKMLRGRAVFRVGPAFALPYDDQIRRAAAAEICHAASLLHDDVIDGSHLRRHLPSFWVRHGASGAILAGDVLWSLCLSLLDDTQPGAPRDLLLLMIREMIGAEVEQELLYRGRTENLAIAERIARGKTGALFAFAAASGVPHRGPVFDDLMEAGFLAGIAYQISDDILDITGDPASGKELGLDRAREKVTAASARDGGLDSVRRRMKELENESRARVAHTPAGAGWDAFWDQDLRPALDRNIAHALTGPAE